MYCKNETNFHSSTYCNTFAVVKYGEWMHNLFVAQSSREIIYRLSRVHTEDNLAEVISGSRLRIFNFKIIRGKTLFN